MNTGLSGSPTLRPAKGGANAAADVPTTAFTAALKPRAQRRCGVRGVDVNRRSPGNREPACIPPAGGKPASGGRRGDWELTEE